MKIVISTQKVLMQQLGARKFGDIIGLFSPKKEFSISSLIKDIDQNEIWLCLSRPTPTLNHVNLVRLGGQFEVVERHISMPTYLAPIEDIKSQLEKETNRLADYHTKINSFEELEPGDIFYAPDQFPKMLSSCTEIQYMVVTKPNKQEKDLGYCINLASMTLVQIDLKALVVKHPDIELKLLDIRECDPVV